MIESVEFKEKDMRKAVSDLEIKFQDYVDKFEKLTATCEAFEYQCLTLNNKNEVYEALFRETKRLIELRDIDSLDELFKGVKL